MSAFPALEASCKSVPVFSPAHEGIVASTPPSAVPSLSHIPPHLHSHVVPYHCSVMLLRSLPSRLITISRLYPSSLS